MLFLLFPSLAYLGSSYRLIVLTFSYVDVCNPNYIQFLSINSGTLNALSKFNKNSTNSKKFKNTDMSLDMMLQQKICTCKCGCTKSISNVYYDFCIFCTLGTHKKSE
jgi:hypothetical protein